MKARAKIYSGNSCATRATKAHFCLFVAATAALCGIAEAADEPAPVSDEVMVALRADVDESISRHEKNVELDRTMGPRVPEDWRDEFEKWGRYLAWLAEEWPRSVFARVPDDFVTERIAVVHDTLRGAVGLPRQPHDCPTELGRETVLLWNLYEVERPEHLAGVYRNHMRFLSCFAATSDDELCDWPAAVLVAPQSAGTIWTRDGLRAHIDGSYLDVLYEIARKKAIILGEPCLVKLSKHTEMRMHPDARKEWNPRDLVKLQLEHYEYLGNYYYSVWDLKTEVFENRMATALDQLLADMGAANGSEEPELIPRLTRFRALLNPTAEYEGHWIDELRLLMPDGVVGKLEAAGRELAGDADLGDDEILILGAVKKYSDRRRMFGQW